MCASMEGAKLNSNSRSYGSTQTKNSTDRVVFIEHVVQINDTLAGLSIKYDVPIQSIRKANRLLVADTIYSEMKLFIPTCLNPATLSSEEINGEKLVIGDSSGPGQQKRHSPSTNSFLDNSLNSPDTQIESLEAQHNNNGTLQKEKSFYDIFNKIDQSLNYVKGNMSTLNKDGFYASHCSSSSEDTTFSAAYRHKQTEDSVSVRSSDSKSSRNISPTLKKTKKSIKGLSSTALQLANDHDSSDFPL